MALDKIKVAIVCWRLGPYHHARLNASGRIMDLYGVEACGMEQTYAWEKIEGGEHFHRITLTEKFSNDRSWRQQLFRRMFEELDKIQPEVLVVPGWSLADALAALQWSVQHGVPVVAMSESTERDEARSAWREAVKRRIVGLFSAALVGGRPHKDYMAMLGVPAERIFLGYDAVDNGYFADKAAEVRSQKSEVRMKLGLPEKYFLASARFIGKKNLPKLIKAYAQYRAKAESGKQKAEIWDLVLLGDGPLRPDLCHLISDLRLQNSVLLPGFKQYPELPAYYGLAGAFIHASTTEQWGLVVNEAMASGLPVLVSNRCGCAADLVQDGVNGFTFDPHNVEEMAKAMLQISAFQDVSLSTFGDASRKIISNWGPERFATGLKQAAECALRVGPAKPTLPQRMILKTLSLK